MTEFHQDIEEILDRAWESSLAGYFSVLADKLLYGELTVFEVLILIERIKRI